MAFSDHLIIILLTLSTAITAAYPAAFSGGCSDEVVAFSQCLKFISLPPNNRSVAPSSACCGEYSAVVGNGTDVCLCHLVRSPMLLGFPLSTERILSLSTLCPLLLRGGANGTIGTNGTVSIEAFCSGSSALPPLQSIEGPRIPACPSFQNQHPSIESPPPPPSTTSSSPEITDSDTLPSEVNLSIITPTHIRPAHTRSVAQKIRNRAIISLGVVISILVPISILQTDTPLYSAFADQVSRTKQSGSN